jgi:hypothetical protein
VGGESRGKDGANELLTLDIIEVGPTLAGANDQTQLLSVKAVQNMLEREERRPRGYRDRAGHPLPPPKTLAPGTFPASQCPTCSSIVSFAPKEVSDASVKREIGRIKAVLTVPARRVDPEILRVRKVLDALESGGAGSSTAARHRDAPVHGSRQELDRYSRILAELGSQR